MKESYYLKAEPNSMFLFKSNIDEINIIDNTLEINKKLRKDVSINEIKYGLEGLRINLENFSKEFYHLSISEKSEYVGMVTKNRVDNKYIKIEKIRQSIADFLNFIETTYGV